VIEIRAFVVGADNLGNIPGKLSAEGFDEIIHWSGRRKSYMNKTLPKEVDVVILLWDFLNHNLMHSVVRQARANGIPIVYNKRGVTGLSIEQQLPQALTGQSRF
jgi:hypothetical protein